MPGQSDEPSPTYGEGKEKESKSRRARESNDERRRTTCEYLQQLTKEKNQGFEEKKKKVSIQKAFLVALLRFEKLESASFISGSHGG